jgi:hypothetical protein
MHAPLLANMGIQMIFGEWLLVACALIPVIGIETFVVHRYTALSIRKDLLGITEANIVSTLVGVPIAWLGAFAIELALLLPLDFAAVHWTWLENSLLLQVTNVILGAAWLGPVDPKSEWIIYIAAAILLIPCFFVSVLIERWVCRRVWSRTDPAIVRRSVWRANICSYAALFAFVCAWSAWTFHSTHT